MYSCTNATFGDDTIDGCTTAYGDCYGFCTGTMGDDAIQGASWTVGDCVESCTGTMGNDTLVNSSGEGYGDCFELCEGTMGDDTIQNANYAYGDCPSSCGGVMGNDTLINTLTTAYGDCNNGCTGITQWATDIFRNTGSNSFAITDFNGGGVDDKIQLPSGVTVSITGTGYSRSLTYSGSYSGTITINCNSSNHDCDNGGSWIVVPCQVYVGGTSLASDATPCGGNCSTAGFDTGSCNFN